MRFLKAFLVVACVIGLSVMLNAGKNQFGVQDTQKITFSSPMRIGDVVIPEGDYRVVHTMQGEDHIMVFTKTTGHVEVKAKCTLVPLSAKAEQTQKIYVMNGENERVLRELVFRGDTAKHVF